jgi:hypothetical protein
MARTTKKKRKSWRDLPWNEDNPRFQALLRGMEEMAASVQQANKAFQALPAKPARLLGWEALRAEARAGREQVPRTPAPEQSAGWRQRLARVIGLPRVPPSYCDFLRWFPRFGSWELAYRKPGWPAAISVPVGDAWLRRERKLLLGLYRTNAAGRRLIPFATNGGDKWFCWDPERVDSRGEPAIYAADSKEASDGPHIKRLGRDLLQILNHYRPAHR